MNERAYFWTLRYRFADYKISRASSKFYALVKEDTPGKYWAHNTTYTIKYTGCTIPDKRLNLVRWVDKESHGSPAGLSNGTHVAKHMGCRLIVELFVNDEMGRVA